MSTTQTSPQLYFELDNPGAPNTVYITTDPGLNKLTLKITTNTDGTLFTPGQFVHPGQPPPTNGSLLYLDLTDLNLTADEFSALAFSAAGWQFQPYADVRQVCMTPEADVPLGSGGSVQVQIQDFALANPPSSTSVQLAVTYYRVQNITLGNMGVPSNFQVVLQNPPAGNADLHQAVALAVPQFYVVNSIPSYQPVQNSLSLAFLPGPVPRSVTAGDATAFTVSFVYADDQFGYGALATPAQAGDFSFQAGLNAENWTVTPSKNLQSPSWLLRPPSGQPILGTGAQSQVEFLISRIVTNFQPGPTLMLVSYTGVPGYEDGSYSVLLEKVPHVDVTTPAVTPNPSHLSNGLSRVTLNWTAANAGTLTLMPIYQDVTGQSSYVADIAGTTTFTLEAQGLQLANAGNVVFKNFVATVLPVINSFDASPSAVYSKDFPRNVNLVWNVNTNEQVRITSSEGVSDPNQYAPVGGVTKSISRPQMLTLSPVGEADDLLLRRNLLLSAFQIQTAGVPVGGGAYFVAASPDAAFVAAVNQGVSQLTILDTLGFKPIGGPVVTGPLPIGVAISPDGGLIFTANSGDGTVSVVPVSATGSNPPYSLGSVTNVHVGGSPRQLAVSPDGKYVYVTCAAAQGGANGTLVVLRNQGGGQFAPVATIDIGLEPSGVAVAPSGAQVFAANSGSNSVSVIGVSSAGQHSLVNTIQNLNSTPTGLAVTPDGATLLVACAGSNKVFGINTQYPGTAPRLTYQVGAKPEQLAIVPGGAYVFVTNNQANTVSLLGYDVNGQNSKVLEAGLPVGVGPKGVAVSPDGGLVIVGCGSTLAVLTLAEYQTQAQPGGLGEQPTSVATAPDGSKVYAWHNSALNVRGSGGGPPSAGLFVYETRSQTVTQELKDSSVVECVFSPLASAGVAYLTQAQNTSITVLDTATCQPVRTLGIPQTRQTPRYPLNLAVSADGTRLFAIVSNGQQQYSLVVYDYDPAADEYDLSADVTLFTASAQATLTLLCASPDGTQAFAVNSVDNKLWMARQDSNGSYAVVQTPVALGGGPSAITILPDGSKVYVLNKAGTTNSISVVDAGNLQVETVYLPEQFTSVSLNALAVSPDGSRVFATDGAAAGIRVLDPATLRFIQTIGWAAGVQNPFGIAVLPDGSRIFTANLNSNNLGIVQQVQPA